MNHELDGKKRMKAFGHLVFTVYSAPRRNGVENLKNIFETGYLRRVMKRVFGMKKSCCFDLMGRRRSKTCGIDSIDIGDMF